MTVKCRIVLPGTLFPLARKCTQADDDHDDDD